MTDAITEASVIVRPAASTLGAVVRANGRDNCINVIRLALAVSVVLWHGIFLGGFSPPGLLRFGSDVGVDGFFVLSGFLISMSWERNPKPFRFLWHRGLRILPAFWTCLLGVAVLGWVTADVSGVSPWTGANSPVAYVVRNLALHIEVYDVAGTPANVPYPHFWNVPLWTLEFEAKAYLCVLALGLVSLVVRRAWTWLPPITALILIALMINESIDGVGSAYHFYLRLLSAFAIGVVAHTWRDRIPFSRCLAAAAIAVTLASWFVLQNDYRDVALVPYGYALLWTGYRFTAPALFRHDISYGVYIYGYVVQQVLALAGLYRWGYLPFVGAGVGLTVLVASASWFWIERPALRLKDWTPSTAGRRRTP